MPSTSYPAAAGTETPAADLLPTPALVIDARVVRRNIERLANYAKARGLEVRPHTKTHKSRRLARLQLDAGATGLTAAKAGEAEQMAQESNDLLVAYPALDPARCRRIAMLARKCNVRVAVDSLMAAQNLSASALDFESEIGLLVDMDVGMGRTGVATPEDCLRLAQQIERIKNVRLDGIFFYPGHVWQPTDNQSAALGEVSAKLDKAIELWGNSGLEPRIVSGGSTPTAYQSHFVRQQTEIRPGTYVFNDMNTVRGGFCSLDDCSARIICTVVSAAVKDQVVLDGGTKTFTSDRCIPAPESGHGYIVEYPDAVITKLSEEHGQVDVSRCGKRPSLGERVSVIPNHICPCVNLRDSFHWLETDGTVRLETVDARGLLS